MQAIQTLEKYKVVLERSIINLSILEFEESVTYNDFILVLHRFETPAIKALKKQFVYAKMKNFNLFDMKFFQCYPMGRKSRHHKYISRWLHFGKIIKKLRFQF